MIISMTGYGKGSHTYSGFEAHVESKSVNHRFLDVFLKLPRSFEKYEHKIREIVRGHMERGRVSINVTLRRAESDTTTLELNGALVNNYKILLDQLSEIFPNSEEVSLTQILSLPDVFSEVDDESLEENAWNCIQKAVEQSVKNLNAMRIREGEEIEKDLRERVRLIEKYVLEIEKKTVGRAETEFHKLKERVENLIDIGELDASRLELEIALLTDRVDVTEECTRLKSHTTVFVESMAGEESSGRKLNFLLQEMNREANTIGAKCNDADMSHLVVIIKEEIEKLREQIQNVE